MSTIDGLIAKANADSQDDVLDELVHETASSMAADVNNGGKEKQVRWLCKKLGMEEAEREIDRHTEMIET